MVMPAAFWRGRARCEAAPAAALVGAARVYQYAPCPPAFVCLVIALCFDLCLIPCEFDASSLPLGTQDCTRGNRRLAFSTRALQCARTPCLFAALATHHRGFLPFFFCCLKCIIRPSSLCNSILLSWLAWGCWLRGVLSWAPPRQRRPRGRCAHDARIKQRRRAAQAFTKNSEPFDLYLSIRST